MMKTESALKQKIWGLDFKNPVIAASGTYGFGEAYSKFYDVNILGGVSTKGLTLEKRLGNKGLRISEVCMGVMNSIGLENPGIRSYIEREADYLSDKDVVILANLGGSTLESYIEAAALLEEASKYKRVYDVLELNISCPNVKEGGMAFGMKPCDAALITRELRKIVTKPLVVKLTPNSPFITDVALAVEAEGADGLSLVNTFAAFDVDIKNRRPMFNNGVAGLSGPAIKQLALKIVRDVCKAVSIPVIGMGGILTYEDAVKFIMVGASLIQFGTASFINPMAGFEIVEGLRAYVEREGIGSLDEIRGIV